MFQQIVFGIPVSKPDFIRTEVGKVRCARNHEQPAGSGPYCTLDGTQFVERAWELLTPLGEAWATVLCPGVEEPDMWGRLRANACATGRLYTTAGDAAHAVLGLRVPTTTKRLEGRGPVYRYLERSQLDTLGKLEHDFRHLYADLLWGDLALRPVNLYLV